MATTRRACANLEPSAEQAYLRALEATTRYGVAGGELALYAGSEVVARLRRGGGG